MENKHGNDTSGEHAYKAVDFQVLMDWELGTQSIIWWMRQQSSTSSKITHSLGPQTSEF